MILELSLDKVPDIRTTDRADEKYFDLRGIRPERIEKNSYGVMIFIYANDQRIRDAVKDYWREYPYTLNPIYSLKT